MIIRFAMCQPDVANRELEHGCDPIPVTREVIAGIQEADPRCTA
jgi:hypothetical protein